MKKSAYLMLFALGAALAAVFMLGGAAVSVTGHAKKKGPNEDCYKCHLNDPERAGGSGRKLLFAMDLTRMCSGCHPGSRALSHPVDVPVIGGSVPAGFPLNWKGRMTCVTCHVYHGEGYSFLRVSRTGKGFCLMCHDMEFFRQMDDRGAALSGAHLETRSTGPRRSDLIDEVSLACLDCHDGTVSIDVVSSIRPVSGFVSHGGGVSHPIGSMYEKKAARDSSYSPVSLLPPQILLPEGRLGCVSCHAPYKEKHGSLVIAREGSRLCFACHKK